MIYLILWYVIGIILTIKEEIRVRKFGAKVTFKSLKDNMLFALLGPLLILEYF